MKNDLEIWVLEKDEKIKFKMILKCVKLKIGEESRWIEISGEK
jgi:hypothetical protein